MSATTPGRGLLRDCLIVLAPVAAVLAGLAAVDHHQRLVAAGYRVAVLQGEGEALRREVEDLRVRVARLAAPHRLQTVGVRHDLPLAYPRTWNRIESTAGAAALVAPPAVPAALADRGRAAR